MKFTICPICQAQMQGDPYRSMVSRIQRYYCGAVKKSQDAHFTFDGFDQTAIYFAVDFTLFVDYDYDKIIKASLYLYGPDKDFDIDISNLDLYQDVLNKLETYLVFQ